MHPSLFNHLLRPAGIAQKNHFVTGNSTVIRANEIIVLFCRFLNYPLSHIPKMVTHLGYPSRVPKNPIVSPCSLAKLLTRELESNPCETLFKS